MSKQGIDAHRGRKLGKAAIIIACWVGLWQLASLAIDNAWLLSGPLETLESWLDLATTGAFWVAIAHSLGRIALGFAVAFVVGVLLGYAAAKLPLLRDFIKPAVAIVKSAPVVCIIALLLVGTGANAATSIVVGLVVFPQFYHAVLEAVRDRDEELDEALRVFGIPNARKALYVDFVALGAPLRSACAIAAGLAWKSGIAAELIGLPALSIGTGVYLAKISLDSATIIAWTATVILLSWLSEKLLLWLVDLLLRLPKLALSRQVHRALRNSGSDSTATRSQMTNGCSVHVEALACSFPLGASDDEGSHALIYESFDIAPSERVCLMAPSGAGKTTLLRLIAGIMKPSAGSVSFGKSADKDAHAQSDRIPMSVMLQSSTLLEWATALENIALVARDEAEIRRGRNMLLQVLNEDDLAKPTHALSGGMKRRAELCRALAHRSELVIADEPFSGLDEITKKHCIELIVQAIQGRTLLMATHDVEDANLLEARVIRL